MKKIKFAILAALILLTGCSKYTITGADKQSAEPVTSDASQPETESQDESLEKKFMQLTMVSMEAGFALSEDNHVYKTSDGGLNWSECYSIKDKDKVMEAYPAIYAVNEQTLYIAAYYDCQTNFISTADGGRTWSTSVINSQLTWAKDDISDYNLDFIDADNGYLLIDSTPGAGQMLKVLYRTTDAGANWDIVVGEQGGEDSVEGLTPTGISGYSNGISFMNSQNGWVVCGSNGAPPYGAYFYKTKNGGKTWNTVEFPEIPQEFSEYNSSELYINASTPSFYGNENKNGKLILSYHLNGKTAKDTAYIYTYSHNETWVIEGKCNSLIHNIIFMDDNNGFGLDTEGYLSKTADGGLTWNKQVTTMGPASN